jgi:CheY-like chemotaxis protein
LTYVDGQVTFALSPRIRGISLARKILLADDSVTAQNMGRKILADAGYEVIAVNNGSAALKKIAEIKPDLVILDVYMPGYSGLEVCQRLKESPETARIPVLLTVGKLEPFKPEEAQRVRAEGFIVKPFEASELLSTLSKLEDKVVPRSEPSKPGRFARAIAAAEESERGGRNDASDADNGWKSRIGFPKKKKAESEEEKLADEAPIYNPVNRDLRTVVETSAEKASESQEEQTRQPAEEAAEPSLDVAAVAPAGLPKDVTPEEVAAIAAAAAQMQMVVSALKEEQQVPAARAEEATTPPGVQPAMQTEAKTEVPAESAAVEADAAQIHRRRKGDISSEETQDVPVTIAATAESVVAASAGRSRWTAVSVALEGSEAAISLDHEMQKAYAAAAATGPASVAAVVETAPSSSGNSFVQAEAAVEPPPAISIPEPEPVREAESATKIVPAEPEPAPVAQLEAAPAAAVPVTPEIAPVEAKVEAPAEASPAPAFSEPNPEPAPVAEFVAPKVEEVAAEPAAVQEAQPQAEPAIAEVASASSPIAHTPEVTVEKPVAQPAGETAAESAAESAAEVKLDSETVKSTAAAWESWRQTRDANGNGKDSEATETQPTESGLPGSAELDTAARAVAAGAEKALQEAAAAAPNGEADNVASIVDSVLADLRPKLMEEINRKMSKKK